MSEFKELHLELAPSLVSPQSRACWGFVASALRAGNAVATAMTDKPHFAALEERVGIPV